MLANGLEIYVKPEAERDGTTDVRHTALAKSHVLRSVFLWHQVSKQRKGVNDNVDIGIVADVVIAVWVVEVLAHLIARTRHERKVDAATGLDVFLLLRKMLTFYVVSAIVGWFRWCTAVLLQGRPPAVWSTKETSAQGGSPSSSKDPVSLLRTSASTAARTGPLRRTTDSV